MTKNAESTRYYSAQHEEAVSKIIHGYRTPNSGAGNWKKGDIINKDASMLCECKTCMQEKDSFSIKQDWIIKNKEEAFSNRLSNQCIAFNFGPNQPSYFVINEKLMRFLIEKLEEEKD